MIFILILRHRPRLMYSVHCTHRGSVNGSSKVPFYVYIQYIVMKVSILIFRHYLNMLRIY